MAKPDSQTFQKPGLASETQCPTTEELSQMLTSTAEAETDCDARVQQHIETCNDCQATLERLTADSLNAPSSTQLPAYLSSMIGRPPNRSPDESPLPQIPGYDIIERIGYGGMGAVYRARHRRLDREVAIKVIAAGQHARAEIRERLDREGRLLAKLNHRNVVQIYDSGEYDGLPFLVLEVVEGGNLADRPDSINEPENVARLVSILARAVAAAHDVGIVHRDLKPANILLERGQLASPGHSVIIDGERFVPKITDFGLSKQLLADVDDLDSGVMMGTPAYMAPEQACEETESIGPKTDSFALGIITWELLTGRRPFEGRSALAILDQIRSVHPPPPSSINSDVPQTLDELCLQCLSKEPGLRPSMMEIVDALDLSRTSPNPGALSGGSRIGVRRLWTGIAIVFALLAGMVIKVKTDVGEIEIVCEDPSVEISIQRNGEVTDSFKVVDEREKRIVGIGDIRISITGAERATHVVSDSQFVLNRGDKAVVTIAKVAEQTAARRAAEFILAGGGKVLLDGGRVPADFITKVEDLPAGPLNIHSLRAGRRNPIQEEDLELVSNIPSLHTLTLTGQRLSARELQHISKLTQLRYLGFHTAKVDDAGLLAAVRQLRKLENLVVSQTQITADGLAKVSHLKTLGGLTLSQQQLLSPQMATTFQQFPNLRSIQTYGVKDSGLENLGPLPQVKLLRIWWALGVTNRGLKAVAGCQNIETLEFGYGNLSGCDPTILAPMTRLKRLTFDHVRIDESDVEPLRRLLTETQIVVKPSKK